MIQGNNYKHNTSYHITRQTSENYDQHATPTGGREERSSVLDRQEHLHKLIDDAGMQDPTLEKNMRDLANNLGDNPIGATIVKTWCTAEKTLSQSIPKDTEYKHLTKGGVKQVAAPVVSSSSTSEETSSVRGSTDSITATPMEKMADHVVYTALTPKGVEELKEEFKTVTDIRTTLQDAKLEKLIHEKVGAKVPNAEMIKKEFGSVENFVKAATEHPEATQLALRSIGVNKEKAGLIVGELTSKPHRAEEIKNGSNHMFLHWEELSEVKHFKGNYALVVPRITTDLDSYLLSAHPPLTLKERLDINDQIMKGVADLHDAGYSHGDLKFDNFLIIEKTGENGERIIEVKLADFGKSAKVGAEGKIDYEGNGRNEPPEKIQTQKGDVYSIRNVMVGVLEAPMVKKNNGEPLVPVGKAKSPKNEATKKVKIAGNEVECLKYRGFESFLTRSADCSQEDFRAAIWSGVRMWVGRKVKSSFEPSSSTLTKEQDACMGYIGKMSQEIEPEFAKSDEETQKQLSSQLNFLMRMSETNRDNRPTMSQLMT